MTDANWLPSLIVLGVGIAAGVILAFKLRAARSEKKDELADEDLDLEIRDLERRRDDLYDRLRGLKGDIDDAERLRLEETAARTLRELDRVQAKVPGRKPAEEKRRAKAPAARPADDAPREPAPAGSLIGRHPLLSGFLLGGGMAAIVGLLIYWAVRDAGPRPDMPEPAPRAAASEEDPHGTGGDLSPEAAARVQELQARLTADATDLPATKELALILLSEGRFFDAYRVAERVLQLQPGDPDGLYVQGVVQLSMGQNDAALEALDTVLAQYPDHLQALIYRGLAQQMAGDVGQAIDTWEYALDVAGGSHPDLEELLRRAQVAQQQESQAPAQAAPPAPAAPAPEEALAPLTPPTDPMSYAVRVRLAEGAVAPRGASLFVFLRTGETGPPVAVKRVPVTGFPMDLVLGTGDSMTGAALPDSGMLFVRLDGDGNASTSEGDLEVRIPARAGTAVEAVLGN